MGAIQALPAARFGIDNIALIDSTRGQAQRFRWQTHIGRDDLQLIRDVGVVHVYLPNSLADDVAYFIGGLVKAETNVIGPIAQPLASLFGGGKQAASSSGRSTGDTEGRGGEPA